MITVNDIAKDNPNDEVLKKKLKIGMKLCLKKLRHTEEELCSVR